MLKMNFGGRFRSAAFLPGAALALGLASFSGGAAAATCKVSSVSTGGVAALGCSGEQPFKKEFDDKIDNIDAGKLYGETFFITVTKIKDRKEAIEGTWSLLPGLTFAKGASYALALKGGPNTIFYQLNTSATSGTWSTADLLVGKKNNQAGLSNIQLYGTKTPVAPVPLPAAAWLLIGGMAGFGALARRRGKSAA
jgi:hypothetical protein